MKRKLIVIIALLLIISSTFLYLNKGVRVTIHNKTGFTIDSLKIGKKFINLKKDTTLKVDEITIQDGSIAGFTYGKIEEKIRDTFLIWDCGTGAKKVTTGKYEFDVRLIDFKNSYRLIYDLHK